jgi:DNA-binding response OmpR family regulator
MPRVLLLDTEPYLFELLKSKLEREGFEVFSDGVALAASPDLIIMGQHHDPAFSLLEINTPVILLGDTDTSELPHLKMPFRPNDLIALAHKTIAA